MTTVHKNQKRWDRFAARCPFIADVPSGHVPAISLALSPSCAIDLPNGITRFRFHYRSARDQFAHAWRSHGISVRTSRSKR